MEMNDDLDFGHRDREDIYNYVESAGEIDPDQLRQTLHMDRRAFGHQVAILKRDGVLTVDDNGDLRVAYHEEAAEEFTRDDVAFEIRQARQSDLSGLLGAIRQFVADKTCVDAETIADIIDNEGVLLRHNEIESRIFFVATVSDDVVGWVHIDHPETEKLSHTAELTIGVLEEYRGQGIGGHLLERGVEWAASKGYEKLYNSVPATNDDAIAFLRAHGWEVEAVREDHYKVDGTYVDETMLARRL